MLAIFFIVACKKFIITYKTQGSRWFFDFLRRFEQSDLRADLRDLVIRSNLALGIAFFYIRSLRHSKISCGFQKNYALLNPLAVRLTYKKSWKCVHWGNSDENWGNIDFYTSESAFCTSFHASPRNLMFRCHNADKLCPAPRDPKKC